MKEDEAARDRVEILQLPGWHPAEEASVSSEAKSERLSAEIRLPRCLVARQDQHGTAVLRDQRHRLQEPSDVLMRPFCRQAQERRTRAEVESRSSATRVPGHLLREPHSFGRDVDLSGRGPEKADEIVAG